VASADVSHVISTLHSGFVPFPTFTCAINSNKCQLYDIPAELTLFITAVDEDGNWMIVKPKLQHEKMGGI
ncbi:hypothetical protein GW17_00054535, partial [Ensete ventricosum]